MRRQPLPLVSLLTASLLTLPAARAAGIPDDRIPAKLEGMALGQDVTLHGVVEHTLYIANDNDSLGTVNGVDNLNQWFVFGFSDADLASLGTDAFVPQAFAVPEAHTYAMMFAGLGLIGVVVWRRQHRDRD